MSVTSSDVWPLLPKHRSTLLWLPADAVRENRDGELEGEKMLHWCFKRSFKIAINTSSVVAKSVCALELMRLFSQKGITLILNAHDSVS